MHNTIKLFLLSTTLSFGLQITGQAKAVSDWALPEYTKAANAGIVTYNVISKNLKEYITREEFCELSVKLYEKLSGEDLAVTNASPFSDANSIAISRAYFYGLVSGTSEDKFEPERFVTRQEIAKILENILNASETDYEIYDGYSKLTDFKDNEQISDWAVPSVSVVTKYSLMSGSDGKFNPYDNATREQAILSIYRAYERFSTSTTPTHTIACTAPTDGTIITDGEYRVSCTSLGKAIKYIFLVKDENGNLVKNLNISTPSAFKINKATLPYGNNYSLTVGATLSDGSETYSAPVNFSYTEPKPEPTPTPTPTPKPTPTPTQKPEDNSVATVPPKSPVQATQTPSPVVSPTQTADPENTPDTEESKTLPDIGYEDEILSENASQIIKEAEKYIGIPYVYGGTTPEGFDCSGFVKYVFNEFGYTLKRVSRDQYTFCGSPVTRQDLQPGDLVFFGTGGIVGHVGIYTGNGEMIHAPSTGKTICYTSIETNYYKTHYIGAKRILE